MRKKEISINLKDLFAELIRKSWIIIIITILMAGGLTGFKYLRDLENAASSDDFISHEEKLSKSEIKEVNAYIQKLNEYKAMEDYFDSSILLSCNPYNTYTMNISISVKSTNEDTLNAAVYAYKEYIQSAKLAADMAESDGEHTAGVFQEVVGLSGSSANAETNIIDIWVHAKDWEQLSYLRGLVKEELKAYQLQLIERFGEHDFSIIEEKEMQLIKDGIIDMRIRKEAQFQSLKNTISTMEQELSAVQKIKVTEIMKNDVDTDEDMVENNEELIGGAETVKISKKYLVIGLVMGAFISVFCIMAGYYFSSSIKTKNEVAELYDVELIGCCSLEKKNVFEKLAERIIFRKACEFTSDEREYVISKICQIVKNNDYQKLVFVGKIGKDTERELQNIIASLTENNVKSVYIGDALGEVDAIKQMEKKSKVILLNEVRKTEYYQIDNEIKLCSELNQDLLGYIAFQK